MILPFRSRADRARNTASINRIIGRKIFLSRSLENYLFGVEHVSLKSTLLFSRTKANRSRVRESSPLVTTRFSPLRASSRSSICPLRAQPDNAPEKHINIPIN